MTHLVEPYDFGDFHGSPPLFGFWKLYIRFKGEQTHKKICTQFKALRSLDHHSDHSEV